MSLLHLSFPTFSLLILFLKEYFSHISSHNLLFAWCIFFLFTTLNLPVCLYLKLISCGLHIVGSYFCCLSVLTIAASYLKCLILLTFSGIIIIEPINLLLVFCFSPVFFVVCSSLCLLLHSLELYFN